MLAPGRGCRLLIAVKVRAGAAAIKKTIRGAGREGDGARSGFADAQMTIKQLTKWLAVALGALVGLVAFAVAAVYAVSELKLRKTYPVPPTEIAVPADSAALTEGQRLATIHGCNGCHGPNFQGAVFFDQPGVARLVAANLTEVARTYSDAELARAVRHGVKRDGRGVAGMPSAMFYDLSDHDLARIIAYVRSRPRVDNTLPPRHVGPLGRLGLVLGQYHLEPDGIDHTRPRLAAEPADRVAYGRYLAKTSCPECHGPNLRGEPGRTPSLVLVVPAYREEQFQSFLRTGVALGGRELPLMSDMARSRFSHFADDEVRALYAYLTSLSAADSAR